MAKKSILELDSRKKDLMDRLREHIFSGGVKKLSKRDSETLAKLDSVNQLLTTGYSVSNCIKKLQNDLGIQQAQAYKLIRDCHELYGNARQANKDGKRYILEEMYMRAAIKAMQMEDIPSYLHALDSIAKLYGLFDATAINISMAQLQMPKVIFANSDLETLKREMEQQTAPLNIDG